MNRDMVEDMVEIFDAVASFGDMMLSHRDI